MPSRVGKGVSTPRPVSPSKVRGGLYSKIKLCPEFSESLKSSSVKSKVPKTRIELNRVVWDHIDRTKNVGRVVSFDSWKDIRVRDALGIHGDVPIFEKDGISKHVNSVILDVHDEQEGSQ